LFGPTLAPEPPQPHLKIIQAWTSLLRQKADTAR